MCAGCMTSAEFVLTSGALSVGAVRLGLRSLRPRSQTLVSDEEAAAFVARLRTRTPASPPAPVIALPDRHATVRPTQARPAACA